MCSDQRLLHHRVCMFICVTDLHVTLVGMDALLQQAVWATPVARPELCVCWQRSVSPSAMVDNTVTCSRDYSFVGPCSDYCTSPHNCSRIGTLPVVSYPAMIAACCNHSWRPPPPAAPPAQEASIQEVIKSYVLHSMMVQSAILMIPRHSNPSLLCDGSGSPSKSATASTSKPVQQPSHGSEVPSQSASSPTSVDSRPSSAQQQSNNRVGFTRHLPLRHAVPFLKRISYSTCSACIFGVRECFVKLMAIAFKLIYFYPCTVHMLLL